MNAGTKVRDQYGKVSIVLAVWDNVIVTTAGTYHATKLFPVK